jgi:Domain of unknown function (DUF4189)
VAGGALAIALPPDVVKTGFSYGSAYNYPSKEEAGKRALERCRDTKSDVRKKLCKVQTFENQCVAVAMDPADGTPGVGWSIMNDLRAAEADALAKCEATAGPGRRAACKVHNSGCDGTAKQ